MPPPPNVERSFLRFRTRGDGDALAAVFDALAPSLHRIAMHLVPDAADADDLVQATFVTAIERADRYDARRPLLPWLVGVLANHANNHRRRARRAEPAGVVDGAGGRSALDRAIDHETMETVRRAIAGLASPYREVLEQHLAEGRGAAEIAARLERAPGTVRLQLHRGLKRLRALLPKGVVAGGVLGASSSRGLAAVRETVLGHAAMHGPAVAAAGVAPTLGGLGETMMLKQVLAAVVLGGGVVSVATFWSDDPPDAARVVREDATAPAAAPPTVPAIPGEDRRPAEEVDAGAPAERVRAVRAQADRIAEARRAAGRFVVRGRVVDAETGIAVEGARVSAGLDAGSPRGVEGVLTDRDGRFEVVAAAPFLRAAWVEADGYAFARAALEGRREGDRHVLDAGTIRLHRGTRVTGRVLDAEGAPVPGATLLLHEPPILFTSFFPADARPVGESDAGGWFDLEAVPPSAEGGTRLFAMAPSGAGRADLDLVAGRARLEGVEVHLLPSTRVDVRVVDGDGAPVAGAEVEAVPLQGTFVLPSFLRLVGKDGGFPPSALRVGEHPVVRALFAGRSGEDGRVTLPRLPVDEDAAYAVVVRAAGFVDGGLDRVDVAPRGHERLEVALEQQAARSVSGVVVTPSGRPVPDAAVTVTATAYVRLSATLRSVTTGPDGRFVFPGVEPATTLWLSVDRDGIARLPAPVDVPADRDVDDVRITARSAEPVTVTVVDQRGLPVEGATATLHQDAVFLAPVPRASGADGVLRFPDAVGGPWGLSVTLPAPKEQWRVARLSETVTGGEALRVEATREDPGVAELIVEVVDAATGLPLEPTDARVWMDEAADGVVSHRWRPDEVERRVGEVRARHLKPGEWRVRVEAGAGAASDTVTVRPGDTVVRMRLEIAAPGRVSGRVVADFPLPPALRVAANRPVLALDAVDRPTGAPVHEVDVAPDGTFRLAASAGALHVSVASEGWRGAQSVQVRSGEEVACEVRLHRGAVLEIAGADGYGDGRLVVLLRLEDGAEVPWIVRHEALPSSNTRRTVAPGRYAYEVLYGIPKPGQVGAELPRIAAGEVALDAGEKGVVTLPLRAGR